MHEKCKGSMQFDALTQVSPHVPEQLLPPGAIPMEVFASILLRASLSP